MTPAQAATEVTPLREGDRMDPREFMRRYEASGLERAELIEGVVTMPTPTSHTRHGRPHAYSDHWRTTYTLETPGVETGTCATSTIDDANVYEPDALRFIQADDDGAPRLAGDYVEFAPDLVCEVSASTVSRDRKAKFRAYQDAGVRECVLRRAEDGELDWFVLRDGRLRRHAPGPDSVYRGVTFPGLWLGPAAAVAPDTTGLSAVLNRGLACREQADFVARLNARRPGP